MPAKPLRPVEIRILDKMAEGKTNKVIARELNISPHTVKNHVHDILNKLGAERRSAAVAIYLRPEGFK